VVKNIEGFESINQLALVTWRESFFTHIEPKMTCAILNLIEGERAGQLIDSELVKAVIECYAELGKC
jgi:cullin 1